uniref:Uncharacterized protein n=1 Tax=Populus trichocarpa TaxID=3694 RepID=B9GKB1_POPTR
MPPGIHQLPEAGVWSIQWQSWRWSWQNAKYPPPFLHAYEDVVTPNIIESLGVCAGIYPFNFRVMVPSWEKTAQQSSKPYMIPEPHREKWGKKRQHIIRKKGPAIPVKTP